MRKILNIINENKLVIIFLVYSIFLFFFIYLKFASENFLKYLFYFNILNHFIALYFGVVAITFFKLENKQGIISFLITLSIFSWLIGEILWQYSNNAVVSIADFFYLLGYPIMTFGIFLAISLANRDFFTKKRNLLLLLISVILVSIIYFKFLPIKWDTEITFIENLVTSGYVIADFILLVSSICLIFVVWDGEYKKAWLYLLIGIILLIIGDTFYAVNYNNYEKGSIFDLSWLYAYLFFSISLYTLKSQAKKSLDFLKEKVMKKESGK